MYYKMITYISEYIYIYIYILYTIIIKFISLQGLILVLTYGVILELIISQIFQFTCMPLESNALNSYHSTSYKYAIY